MSNPGLRAGNERKDHMVHAIVVEGTGSADMLRSAEFPAVPLGDGEVRVEVRLAGVNFWDVMQRKGIVPLGEGSVPGVEGVGQIVEVGEGVEQARIGERVVWSKVGSSYASEVVAAATSFVPVPDGLSDEDAARILMQGVTAQYLAEDTWPLGEGDVALVHAAAGGVGTLLTQLLKARGARVIGVVSREEKRQASLDAGADHVLVDGDDYVADVRAIEADGVSAVFDANGGPQAVRALDVLRTRGALVLYGSANGPVPEVDLGRLGAGSFFVTRTAGRDYARTPEEWRARADDVLSRAAAGTLRAVAGGIYPLAEAAQAHRHLESRASVGKLLLSVG